MISGITDFSDDCGTPPSKVTQKSPFKSLTRNRIMNPEYEVIDNEIYIQEYKQNIFEPNYATEYIIELNNEKYLIPSETLSSKYSISLNDIHIWLM